MVWAAPESLFDISAGCSAETCIWLLSKHFCPTASSAEKQVVPQFCSYFARLMDLEFFCRCVSSRNHILTIKLLEVMDCFLVCSFYELLWNDSMFYI